jgi:hypothetical protein
MDDEKNIQEIVKEKSGEPARQVATDAPLPKPVATACDCPPGCVGLPCCD